MTDPVRLDELSRSQVRDLRSILLATLAADRPGRRRELARLIRRGPIGALPDAAALHRVAGSVARGLDDVDGVPSEVIDGLTRHRRRAAARHLLVGRALHEIARCFDDAGISWLVMKGPAVAALLYVDPGDRTYGDLDLLIDCRDFPVAVGLLEQLGYVHAIRNWTLAEKMGAGELAMSNGQVDLDVHWHLLYSDRDRRPFAIDPGLLLDRARRVPIAGRPTPTPDVEDTLLALAFHAARSDGHRLVWFKDIERSLAVERPDLDRLVERSHEFACAPPVGLALARARRLLDADVPDDVVRSLTPLSLRMVELGVSSGVHPIQFHERQTPTRWLMRSVKSSARTSIAALPSRGSRAARDRLVPRRVNETDDPHEKAAFLASVARRGRTP